MVIQPTYRVRVWYWLRMISDNKEVRTCIMAEERRSYLRKIIWVQERRRTNRRDLGDTRERVTMQRRERHSSTETGRRKGYDSFYSWLKGEAQGRWLEFLLRKDLFLSEMEPRPLAEVGREVLKVWINCCEKWARAYEWWMKVLFRSKGWLEPSDS